MTAVTSTDRLYDRNFFSTTNHVSEPRYFYKFFLHPHASMSTTPWNHRYQYADGTAGGAGAGLNNRNEYYVSVSASAILEAVRQQQQLLIQHGQAPPSFVYGEPSAAASGQPQIYLTSSGHSADGFSTQTHHLHLQPAIPPPPCACIQQQQHPMPRWGQESLHYYSAPMPVPVQVGVMHPSVQVQAQAQAFPRDSLQLQRSVHFHQSNAASAAAAAESHSSPHTHECSSSSTSPQAQGKGKQLFVCNLPCSFTDEELRAMFSAYGIVTRASIARCESGKSKGYAFIKYKLQSSAEVAKAHLNQFEVSMLYVSCDWPVPVR